MSPGRMAELGIALVAIAVVSGCAPGAEVPGDSVRGPAPESGFVSQQRLGGSNALPDEATTVTWFEDDRVAITTWGSGSCPVVPLGFEEAGSSRLLIGTGVGPSTPCTADMSATTTTIDRPDLWPVGVELRLLEAGDGWALEPIG